MSPSFENFNFYALKLKAVWLVFYQKEIRVAVIGKSSSILKQSGDIFSGVIELCRRLGHEAFGEEDDEVCSTSLRFELVNTCIN